MKNSRMILGAVATAAVLLAPAAPAAAASAKGPHCKILSTTTRTTQITTPDGWILTRIYVTTTMRCRGEIVTTTRIASP